ncbi:MAG: response regulator transcription factor [Halioglobus sp.]|nr:response regulator transcription factor [Halioglobus sp.]
MRGSEKIYVVDDDPDILTVLSQTLRRSGLDAETYSSCKRFLSAYDAERPGCILLDISMPEMDGMQLLDALNNKANETPVIFLTGTATVGSAVEALKCGAVDFIEKPYRAKALLASVQHALALDRERRERRGTLEGVARRFEKLTAREKEVMSWMAEGKANKVIAAILDISSRTVEIYRKNIYEKMEADSVAEIVKMKLLLDDS